MASSEADTAEQTVDLIKLAASALASSVAASRPIRELARHASGSLSHARLKLDGTLVTDADFAAQHIIVDAMRKVSASVRIVGEESRRDAEKSRSRGFDSTLWDAKDEQSEVGGIFQMALEEIERRYSQSVSFNSNVASTLSEADTGHTNTEGQPLVDTSSTVTTTSRVNTTVTSRIKASRVCVFIDPLDGTKSYSKGDYDAVTTLVAIIVDNVPMFGVICKPFGHEGESSILDSGCFAVYGGTLINGAFIAGGDECDRSKLYRQKLMLDSERLDGQPKKVTLRAIISRSKAGGVVKRCIDSLSDRGLLHRNPIFVSGAGAKALCLVCGTDNESLWFFPKEGTSLWDVAAADAILRVMGGRLSDKDGNDLDYSKSRHDAENSNGVVACSDVVLHAECIRLFHEEKWEDDDAQ